MCGLSVHTIIVGAGISGLLAARSLTSVGQRVAVLEKSRGRGGRMATRRMGSRVLDHGAQYFTTRDRQFLSFVTEWKQKGLLREWFAKSRTDGSESICLVGSQGMTTLPKFLAQDLLISQQFAVESIRYESGRWICYSKEGDFCEGQNLIVTAPLPQAVTLLSTCNIQVLDKDDHARFSSVEYDRCLALLLALSGPTGIPEPGFLSPKSGPVSWISDNAQKGMDTNGVGVTLHSTPQFALDYWDAPDEERIPVLLRAVSDIIYGTIEDTYLHRWRYARPLNPLEDSYYWDSLLRIGLAGDSFLGGRVEDAALSGLALAKAVAAT